MGLTAISCNLSKSVLHHAYDDTDIRPPVNRSHWAQDARNAPRIWPVSGASGNWNKLALGVGWSSF